MDYTSFSNWLSTCGSQKVSPSMAWIRVPMPGKQRWTPLVMGRRCPIVVSCHLFFRMRKMYKYTNFKRTSRALWWAGMVCAVTVGEILAIADHQINGTIFYMLYLPVCNLALDIHQTVFMWKYSQDNIILHVHKHHLTGTLGYMGKVMMLHMGRISHFYFTFLNVNS